MQKKQLQEKDPLYHGELSGIQNPENLFFVLNAIRSFSKVLRRHVGLLF